MLIIANINVVYYPDLPDQEFVFRLTRSPPAPRYPPPFLLVVPHSQYTISPVGQGLQARGIFLHIIVLHDIRIRIYTRTASSGYKNEPKAANPGYIFVIQGWWPLVPSLFLYQGKPAPSTKTYPGLSALDTKLYQRQQALSTRRPWITKMYPGRPSLSTNSDPGTLTLGTKMYQRLKALGGRRYLRSTHSLLEGWIRRKKLRRVNFSGSCMVLASWDHNN